MHKGCFCRTCAADNSDGFARFYMKIDVINNVFLAVFLISRMTEGYFYGIIGAIASVFFVNYVFTYPYMQLDFTLSGYPITFITMMIVAGVTSTMT